MYANLCSKKQSKKIFVSSIWFLCWYVMVLLPENLKVFTLIDMARVNIQDKTVCQLNSASNWIFGKIGKSSIRQVSNNIMLRPAGTVEQRIRSYWSAWKHPPAYSVGHEKLISTPLWDWWNVGVMMIKDAPAKHGRKLGSCKLYECLLVVV